MKRSVRFLIFLFFLTHTISLRIHIHLFFIKKGSIHNKKRPPFYQSVWIPIYDKMLKRMWYTQVHGYEIVWLQKTTSRNFNETSFWLFEELEEKGSLPDEVCWWERNNQAIFARIIHNTTYHLKHRHFMVLHPVN